jgi:hypothetical protein
MARKKHSKQTPRAIMRKAVPGGKARTAAAGRSLTMRYAGGVVKHLGLSMYRGAVPAIAELIANAWDADSSSVELTIPLGTPLNEQQEIRVRDRGRGMTWEDCQDQYLVVGRDRRIAEESDRSEGGRLLMGRKGLGKLAGFGIAEVVEVRTVRAGWLTHFAMDFVKMTKGGKASLVESYRPDMIADEAVNEPNGTEIILKRVILRRTIDENQFRAAMARRFAILGGQFRVFINDSELLREQTPVQFRMPNNGTTIEDIPGVGPVSWWVGFTEKPIDVDTARGISVIVRGRMAQTPFFFDLSGGTHGQHGMQYMTGEVMADQLDGSDDYVATDRQAIVWTEPMPAALLKWGEERVRKALSDWVNRRTEANRATLKTMVSKLDHTVEERISNLRPTEQIEARKIVYELASIHTIVEEPDRAKELLDLVLRAFEDSSFFALLKALSATDQGAREEVLKLVTELDVFETVKMAEVVRARVGIIQKFKEMIQADVPEKPDMQNFLYNHTWLIDPEWNVVEHEKRLETLLIDHFGLDPNADPDSGKRVDFFCIATRGRFMVVEVKRPSHTIAKKDVQQIIDYVSFLRQSAPGTAGSPNIYSGILIGHHLSEDGRRWAGEAEKSDIRIRTWEELMDVAERIHKDFLAVVRKRAPEGDPRLLSLDQMHETLSEGHADRRKRDVPYGR